MNLWQNLSLIAALMAAALLAHDSLNQFEQGVFWFLIAITLSCALGGAGYFAALR